MEKNELKDLKQLFIRWVEEAAIEATKKGTKAALLYNKALDKLRNFDKPIEDPKTLKLIQFVGTKTVEYLTKKLTSYCNDNNFIFPDAFKTEHVVNKRKMGSDDAIETTKKPKKKKTYVPRQRSGGYAILIALYLKDKNQVGLNKNELINVATPFADKSFTANPSSNEFYSAWDSMKILIKNDLVYCTGRSPKLYLLTDEGIELAKNLKETEALNSSPYKETKYDHSFDNNLRVSPDSSYVLHKYPVKNNGTRIIDTPSKTTIKEYASSPCGNDSSLLFDQILNEEDDQHSNNIEPSSPIKAQSNQQLPIQHLQHDSTNRIYDNIKYEIWPHGDYEIILIIDNREVRSKLERDFFQTRLESYGVTCDVRPLCVGDSLWIARNKSTNREVVLNYICERKKLDDLAFSIKDGRFQEQKHRLKKTGMKHFYYIIEEAGIDKVTDMGDAIQSATSMTILLSKFYVKKSKTIEDTINFLSTLTAVIKGYFEKRKMNILVLKPRSINSNVDYLQHLDDFRLKFENRSTPYECAYTFPVFHDLFSKSGMVSVKEMFILMLMSIRGISLEKAVVIQAHFQTPKKLLQFFHEENKDLSIVDKKMLMMKLFKNQVGNKKIGKVVLERIYDIWGDK